MKGKITLSFSFLILFIFVLIYTSRNPLIADDITPVSSCPALIEKSDLLFVIPNYTNHSLDLYPEWCEEMRLFNKTIGLHGITHEYHEFDKKIDSAKLEETIKIVEHCFGYRPTLFRPPYNKISSENKMLIESFNLTLYQDTYLLHTYCHCEPSLLMRPLNWIIGC